MMARWIGISKRCAAWLQRGLEDSLAAEGITSAIAGKASMSCASFVGHAPRDWDDMATHHDFDLDRRYHAARIARDVCHFPLPCKQLSISATPSDENLARTLEVRREAIAAL